MALDDPQAISMEPVKEKLRNLRQHLPSEQQIVYDFAAYLADRLNHPLVPMGFNMAAELVLYDMGKGVDEFTKKPMPGHLTGYPPQLYAVLRMTIPEIAEAACPKDFARGVREVFEEVSKRK